MLFKWAFRIISLFCNSVLLWLSCNQQWPLLSFLIYLWCLLVSSKHGDHLGKDSKLKPKRKLFHTPQCQGLYACFLKQYLVMTHVLRYKHASITFSVILFGFLKVVEGCMQVSSVEIHMSRVRTEVYSMLKVRQCSCSIFQEDLTYCSVQWCRLIFWIKFQAFCVVCQGLGVETKSNMYIHIISLHTNKLQ